MLYKQLPPSKVCSQYWLWIHPDSVRVILNREHPEAVPEAQLIEAKLDIVKRIAPFASAVALDVLPLS